MPKAPFFFILPSLIIPHRLHSQLPFLSLFPFPAQHLNNACSMKPNLPHIYSIQQTQCSDMYVFHQNHVMSSFLRQW
ncbi:hypothetical protein B0J15DRAFT_32328 [Fusarium solani]|uniref:Uncharacterized protein n=1 Tax=Fusarium solani TaxID=169388 RepID=A0A9P9L9B5_FUSSL|nr:uncharacterized protein B0J15DRAFT_32328 [Fusarium solani]KAH7276169.1 hypothetical protein B0J15DRAFT_32328 [Fusarium solani]